MTSGALAVVCLLESDEEDMAMFRRRSAQKHHHHLTITTVSTSIITMGVPYGVFLPKYGAHGTHLGMIPVVSYPLTFASIKIY